MSKWRVGIDIGGTFTDVVGMEIGSGRLCVTKVPSVPRDPSQAVVNGLESLFEHYPEIEAEDIEFFAHGTTVATNAAIEGKGAKSGLLITKGFSATYNFRGGARYANPTQFIDPFFPKPQGLIPMRRTFEVGGRLDYIGNELEPLNEDDVRTAARALKADDVKSVAVCYLFSFANPAHEQRTLEILKEEHPDCRVSLSSVVLPTIREYFRLSTTALDAYVGPVVATYLNKISRKLTDEVGLGTKQLFIMQSNGGLMQIDIAAEYPNQTLVSGPAAGVVFGASVGALAKEKNVVTFDIGGTSTDISVLPNNQYSLTRQGKIHDQDIATPMIEVRALGAGGGTIAWIGPDGLLKAGPHSAGADPGPACYGLGGENATVTDANIVLGYLNPDNFIGGRFKIKPELAKKAILEKVAKPLGLDLEDAALGIIKIMCVNMEVGLRLSLVQKGLDPREFALLAFGGGGPVQACQVAAEMGFPRVIVPPYPGISCAMGLLQTDIKHSYLQSYLGSLGTASVERLNALYESLEERARREAVQEGLNPKKLKLTRALDLRYPYQGYDLTVECPKKNLTDADKPKIRAAFNKAHEEAYGTAATKEVPDIVNVRVTSLYEVPKLNLPPAKRKNGAIRPVGKRKALFDKAKGYVMTPVFDRAALTAGWETKGPVIIEQLDSTTVVLPGQRVKNDRFGNLIIDVQP